MDVYLAQGRITEKIRKRYAYKFGGLQLGRKLQAPMARRFRMVATKDLRFLRMFFLGDWQ